MADGEGEVAENELARQLATLALAEVGPSGPVEAAAAAGWWNLLARLGLFPPLVVVHDLGLLLTRARQGAPRRIRPVPPPAAGPLFERYEALPGPVPRSEATD